MENDVVVPNSQPNGRVSKLLRGLKFVAPVVAAVWGLYTIRPDFVAEPGMPVIADDPYKWNFLITNKGKLPAGVTTGCVIREVQFQEGYEADAWAYASTRFDTLPLMSTGQQISVLCPQYLQVFRNPKTRGGAAHFSNEEDRPFVPPQGFEPLTVNGALAEITINYHIWVIYPPVESRRFVGRRDQNKKLVWSPVGTAVRLLKPLSQQGRRFTLQKCEKPWREGASYTFSIGAGFATPQPCPK